MIEPGLNESLDKRLTIRRSRLEGAVRVSGAKNSALRLLAASLLTEEPVFLDNHPADLLDAVVHAAMLERLGKRIGRAGDSIVIDEAAPPASTLDWPGRSIRNTLLILGALVARTGAGSVPMPGGCDIGGRGYDLHELVLRALGAEVWASEGRLHAEAPHGLTGAEIVLPLRSTGATENALICACLARGTTRLWNPHVRPEILDLIAFLTGMGARIEVFGQESIVVHGVERLGGVRHHVVPDNMEAITWLVGAVMTGGEVEIANFPVSSLTVPLIFLGESGARFAIEGDRVRVVGGRPYPVDISTGPYPGINSDMQPLFAVYGACARGESRIVDLRFPDRYGYAAELAKLGADVRVHGGMLRVRGGCALTGAAVRALDLRAGAALALMGLVAEGETHIADAWQIDRGYQDFAAKLVALGADIAVAVAPR